MAAVNTLDDAIAALGNGGLVVLPTDTVYGLAAHLSFPRAIEAIFTLKGRPESKPLPVLASGVDQLADLAVIDDRARAIAERFWPGPLTLILPRAEGFDVDLGGGGVKTVGVRIPKEPRTLELLRLTGPLAVTSANRSGGREATTVEEARAELGEEVAVYIDGGRCVGIPSTVVFLAGERRLLREGPIPSVQIYQMLSE